MQEAEHAKHTWWTRAKDIVLGPHVTEGAWRPLKRPDSRFVERWGTLFEENRGPPMVLRNATWRVDPVTGASRHVHMHCIGMHACTQIQAAGAAAASCRLCCADRVLTLHFAACAALTGACLAGFCDRGRLEPRLGTPLLKLGKRRWYRHHFQAFGSGAEILKVISYAVATNAPTSNQSWAQVCLLRCRLCNPSQLSPAAGSISQPQAVTHAGQICSVSC